MNRFFPPAEPQQLGNVADAVGATVDPAARERIMSDVMPLDTAGPEHISFLRDAKRRKDLAGTKAGAVFLDERFVSSLPEGCVALVTKHAANAFGIAAGLFHSSAMRPRPLTSRSGGEIAATAIIEDPDALEANVIVEAFAVISRGVEIGRGTVIGPNVVIGPGCTIGRNSVIGANTTIQCAHIGDRVIVHPGCRIGQDGFGLVRTPQGYRKVPQVGAVVIQDDVEIGANCCIDRGSKRDTVIGKGSKIDNLVQIAHNVTLGCHCVVAGTTGIAGSVTLGDYVTLGGGVGIRDGVTIGQGAQIAGYSAVSEDVPENATWGGTPAMDAMEWIRERKAILRLIRNATTSNS
ncbi:UDP-3-O-(3-hydroxymyristoyl)glucosamine N-acyltransferase [Acuticoccus sp. I52.16.1]|uniref:UDP-3-O-(3-hydroxymyristoyl)glucosamine N-acyltransferase n=1 Tax=Acuticoccus sp. I52.16.1 TaxID=2928472 RepID=UPI001FD45427|nr:UDP-3-O-(3-hydroxymyristoyl)glucosamine N-acyltransferase [Acuticoccus sp. I52.16.1]UOM34809.1 UDP-3-O-(3-hydroxymyristoyl)glucosamine N-acyltransferase [Acuticoccus sp. I52.16.1]